MVAGLKHKDTVYARLWDGINGGKEGSVVILDEITSSLSYENEELVKNAIKEITKDKICFIIAHRLTTIKSCNKILYMENGKILENGSHKELMDIKGKYYNLVKN